MENNNDRRKNKLLKRPKDSDFQKSLRPTREKVTNPKDSDPSIASRAAVMAIDPRLIEEEIREMMPKNPHVTKAAGIKVRIHKISTETVMRIMATAGAICAISVFAIMKHIENKNAHYRYTNSNITYVDSIDEETKNCLEEAIIYDVRGEASPYLTNDCPKGMLELSTEEIIRKRNALGEKNGIPTGTFKQYVSYDPDIPAIQYKDDEDTLKRQCANSRDEAINENKPCIFPAEER